jgi:hypothetical protein
MMFFALALPVGAQEGEPIDDWDDVISVSLSNATTTGGLTVESPLGADVTPPDGPQLVATGSTYFAVPGGPAALAPPAGADYWFPQNWDFFALDGFVVHTFVISGWDQSLAFVEAAVFLSQQGQPGLSGRPDIPNDPGVGAVEVTSLVSQDGESVPVWGREEGGELGIYLNPYPVISGDDDEIRIVFHVTPDGTKPATSVLSWAKEASGPGSIGFVRSSAPAVGVQDPITVVPAGTQRLELGPLDRGAPVAGSPADEEPTVEQDDPQDDAAAEQPDVPAEEVEEETAPEDVTEPLAAEGVESEPATSGFPTQAAVIALFVLIGAVLGIRFWRGRPALERVITTEPYQPPRGSIHIGSNALEGLLSDAWVAMTPQVDEWKLLDFEDAKRFLTSEKRQEQLKELLPEGVPWDEDSVGIWSNRRDLRVGTPTDPYGFTDRHGWRVEQPDHDADRAKQGDSLLGGDEDDVLPL